MAGDIRYPQDVDDLANRCPQCGRRSNGVGELCSPCGAELGLPSDMTNATRVWREEMVRKGMKMEMARRAKEAQRK